MGLIWSLKVSIWNVKRRAEELEVVRDRRPPVRRIRLVHRPLAAARKMNRLRLDDLEQTSASPILFVMTENVYWIIELAVNPGRFEDLETLVAELLEANQEKVGFLTYGVLISDDRQVCHIYERFQDSAAIINHMQSFGPTFATRFLDILKPTRFVIYGTPSAEVKEAVAEFNPVYMTPLADFRKL